MKKKERGDVCTFIKVSLNSLAFTGNWRNLFSLSLCVFPPPQKYKQGFILDPVCMSPQNTLRDLLELKKKSGFSGIPVTGSCVLPRGGGHMVLCGDNITLLL